MADSALTKQLANLIGDVIRAKWLNGYGSVEVRVCRDPRLQGGTDASIFGVCAELGFVVKFHLQDVPHEIQGYATLSTGPAVFRKHLVKPLLTGHGNSAVLITPLLVAPPLHTVIREAKIPARWIVDDLYGDFLSVMKTLWKHTLCKTPAPIEDIYIGRIAAASQALERHWGMSGLRKYRMKVNGESFRSIDDELQDIAKVLKEQRARVRYSCVVHGDEHGKNILVANGAAGLSPGAWQMIDYVRASRNGDWVFSVAKMLHWWRAYYAIENAKGGGWRQLHCRLRLDKRSRTIHASYDRAALLRGIPSVCRTLDAKVVDFASVVGPTIFKDTQLLWRERLRIALFAVFLGSAPRHFDAGGGFAVPIMIGEGLRCLHAEE